MPQKTRVGNGRSQSTTDVARRRNRNEKLYKGGARSSVTLAAQNADRRAAVSEIELAYMDPSSVASTPFFGFEVRLLTYIRPLPAASSYRCRAIMGYSRASSQSLSRPERAANSRVSLGPGRPVGHPAACFV